jgi:hypothetical protein
MASETQELLAHQAQAGQLHRLLIVKIENAHGLPLPILHERLLA